MEGKDLLASKTTWGVLIGLIAPWLEPLGLPLNALAGDLAAVFGALLALYGRVKADKPIKSVAGVKK